jgi:hypothetical protein
MDKSSLQTHSFFVGGLLKQQELSKTQEFMVTILLRYREQQNINEA